MQIGRSEPAVCSLFGHTGLGSFRQAIRLRSGSAAYEIGSPHVSSSRSGEKRTQTVEEELFGPLKLGRFFQSRISDSSPRSRTIIATGVGETLNLSSGGVCFEAERPLPDGLMVELFIAWPALLNKAVRMGLRVTGDILRSEGRRIVVRIERYEFRTRGTPDLRAKP